jgi:hypothetical protein
VSTLVLVMIGFGLSILVRSLGANAANKAVILQMISAFVPGMFMDSIVTRQDDYSLSTAS